MATARKTTKKRSRVTVKEMKFRNDPMIRLYDKTQDWLQEKGRPFVRVVAAIAVAVLLYTAGYYFLDYRKGRAAAAYSDAWEKYSAQVVDGSTTTQVGKYYTDENVKWQEAGQAFERVADSYSSYYGAEARYLAGVSYLHIDKEKGLRILQEVADKNTQPTSDLARFALAQHFAGADDPERAARIYESLLNSPFVPRQVVQLELGRVYEKAGDNQKAADFFFEAAKADRSNSAGANAEKRLSAIAPERVKEIPPPSALPLPR